MKKKLSKFFIGVLSVGICLSIISCSKMFDIQPKSVVSSEQMYRNVYDADAAVIGVYGKFMGLAQQYVVLNEVRSDMADVTAKSDIYLKQLNTHTVTVDNPYANPRPFYEVIMDCNDVLKNFNIMINEHKMSIDQYNQRYSDIGALRSWLYLQMGIHFGTIPYVTEPIENLNDLQNEAKFPRIGFDQLLDNLLQFTEALPYKSIYAASEKSLLATYDGWYTGRMFINKACILGDLNLWKGNYTKAATYYRTVMETSTVVTGPGQSNFESYKISYTSDINGGNWRNIFSRAYGETFSNYEMIWGLPFDKNFAPNNPFIDMFSVTRNYLLKPSDLAINNWKIQNDARVGRAEDLRGNYASYRMVGVLPEVYKYTGQYDPLQPFATNGKWMLYRASNLHLRFSEAANRDGRDRLALAFVNNSVPNAYDNTKISDKTLLMQSMSPTDPTKFDTPPYYFDGRNGTYPYFRQPWYRGYGIRNRASVDIIRLDSTKYFDLTVSPRVLRNPEVLKDDVEDIIINESGLETAFEGNRWGDLLRIALRRQATDPNYLANKIGAKFDAAHSADAGAVRAKLVNKANWYLPFRWK
jgi:hypothetical protein